MKHNQIIVKVKKGFLLFTGLSILFLMLDCSGQKPKENNTEKESQSISFSEGKGGSVVLDLGVSKVDRYKNQDSITYTWDIKKQPSDLVIEGYTFSIAVVDKGGSVLLDLKNQPLDNPTFAVSVPSGNEDSLPYKITTKVEVIGRSSSSFNSIGNTQVLAYSNGIVDVIPFRVIDGTFSVDSICAMDTTVCAYTTLYDSFIQNADTTLELSSYILYNIYSIADIQECICDESTISNIDSLFDCISSIVPVGHSTMIQDTVSQDSSLLCDLL